MFAATTSRRRDGSPATAAGARAHSRRAYRTDPSAFAASPSPDACSAPLSCPDHPRVFPPSAGHARRSGARPGQVFPLPRPAGHEGTSGRYSEGARGSGPHSPCRRTGFPRFHTAEMPENGPASVARFCWRPSPYVHTRLEDQWCTWPLVYPRSCCRKMLLYQVKARRLRRRELPRHPSPHQRRDPCRGQRPRLRRCLSPPRTGGGGAQRPVRGP